MTIKLNESTKYKWALQMEWWDGFQLRPHEPLPATDAFFGNAPTPFIWYHSFATFMLHPSISSKTFSHTSIFFPAPLSFSGERWRDSPNQGWIWRCLTLNLSFLLFISLLLQLLPQWESNSSENQGDRFLQLTQTIAVLSLYLTAVVQHKPTHLSPLDTEQ